MRDEATGSYWFYVTNTTPHSPPLFDRTPAVHAAFPPPAFRAPLNGWLSLDRRGQWRLKGETIGNHGLRAFISTNYLGLPDGRYAFQNGSQRVFVELEYTPWVLSLDGAGELRLHTGAQVRLEGAAWMDEQGALLLQTSSGIALLDDRDLEAFTARMLDRAQRLLGEAEQTAAIEGLLGDAHESVFIDWHGQRLEVGFLESASVPDRFGFEPSPG